MISKLITSFIQINSHVVLAPNYGMQETFKENKIFPGTQISVRQTKGIKKPQKN